MASIPKQKVAILRKLYVEKKRSMREIAEYLDVSINAVVYCMRHHGIERRSPAESNRTLYERSKPSFTLRRKNGKSSDELDSIGAMLYWAEGYKRDTASGIDFANSDPDMVLLFLSFLRTRYVLDGNRLHFSLYYYSNQEKDSLIHFWAKKLGVGHEHFKNHYCKMNPNPGARQLPHGVLHIRYNDKKLLRDVINLIDLTRSRYCVGGRAVNYTSL